jgi:hypothetical protein
MQKNLSRALQNHIRSHHVVGIKNGYGHHRPRLHRTGILALQYPWSNIPESARGSAFRPARGAGVQARQARVRPDPCGYWRYSAPRTC